MTNDRVIRQALRSALSSDFRTGSDVPIVEEFVVSNGDGRVDMVVLQSCVHGYEIKSDRDRLDRLPDQIRLFSAALGAVTLVTGWRHVTRVMQMVPRWWGVQLAEFPDDVVRFVELREPLPNPNPDPYAVANLLWRDEALATLEMFGFAKGFRAKPRAVLYDRLAKNVPICRLRRAVAERIKARGDWRFGVPST